MTETFDIPKPVWSTMLRLYALRFLAENDCKWEGNQAQAVADDLGTSLEIARGVLRDLNAKRYVTYRPCLFQRKSNQVSVEYSITPAGRLWLSEMWGDAA